MHIACKRSLNFWGRAWPTLRTGYTSQRSCISKSYSKSFLRARQADIVEDQSDCIFDGHQSKNLEGVQVGYEEEILVSGNDRKPSDNSEGNNSLVQLGSGYVQQGRRTLNPDWGILSKGGKCIWMNSWTQKTRPYSQQRSWEFLVWGITSLFFADDAVLLVPSVLDLRQETSWFSTKYEACGMRICTSKSEAMVLWQKNNGRLWLELLPEWGSNLAWDCRLLWYQPQSSHCTGTSWWRGSGAWGQSFRFTGRPTFQLSPMIKRCGWQKEWDDTQNEFPSNWAHPEVLRYLQRAQQRNAAPSSQTWGDSSIWWRYSLGSFFWKFSKHTWPVGDPEIDPEHLERIYFSSWIPRPGGAGKPCWGEDHLDYLAYLAAIMTWTGISGRKRMDDCGK